MTHTNGPVPLDSADYITRRFETETLAYVYKREWVLLLGPRQHGKTSALIRIRRNLRAAGLLCAFVDLQALPPSLDFPALLEWVARRISATIGSEIATKPPGRGDSLEDWLSCAIPTPSPPVVILIDEASAIVDDSARNAFFGQIRALKSAAEYADKGSVCSVVQFVFAGTFRPETLVDERNSPFNVCRRVDTDDLTLSNVETLARIALDKNDVSNIPQLIFSTVGGQPHLVQHILAAVVAQHGSDQNEVVAAELERMRRHGSDHIDSVFGSVVADANLIKIAAAAAANGQVLNDPANVDYKFIQVLGLMRRQEDVLVFRNLLYKQIAEASPQLRPDRLPGPDIPSHFFTLTLASFSFIVDSEYREISCSSYNGAVTAMSSRHYRLALVAFGVALEALLIDFLIQQSSVINSTISAMLPKDRPKFNSFENQNDPSTWRLVNLMKVARKLRGAPVDIEIPDALREMRNLVHPAEMKKIYRTEAELQPEAVAAGGLFGITMRDVQK